MKLLPWWTAVVFSRANLRAWGVILAREGRRRSLWAKGRMLAGILWHGVKISSGHGVTRTQWECRMKICKSCPIFDASLRRCRPYDGSELGCGCAVWLIALARVPYRGSEADGCWGRAYLTSAGIGWE